MSNLEIFLSASFWFNSRPPRLIPFFENLLIVVIFVFLILAIFSFYKKRSKGKTRNFYITVWRSFYYFCLTNLAIGVLLLFFNYEGIPFLSARFWYIVWFLIIATWLFFIFKFTKKIPEKIKKAEKEEKYKKYLP